MSAAEFIDKILTPVGAGAGVLIASRTSKHLKQQPWWVGVGMAVAVAGLLFLFKRYG